MISKFFIDRPVLANVLAIVMVLLGAVALFVLPVAQYPNVVPPTVSVTTRYPGASADTVMNTVALPLEQQVNGVQGMLYMQSTSASDGTYSLIVTFEIGTDLELRAGAGAEPRVRGDGVAAPGGAGAGRDGAAEIDVDSADRYAHLAGRALRQPVPEQLRHHQPGSGAFAHSRRRQCRRVRCRAIFDADLAGPAKAVPRAD